MFVGGYRDQRIAATIYFQVHNFLGDIAEWRTAAGSGQFIGCGGLVSAVKLAGAVLVLKIVLPFFSDRSVFAGALAV